MTTNIIYRERKASAENALLKADVPALMAKLFASRGIENASQLSSQLQHLLPPATLTNNPAMAVHLADAIDQQKKILVIGDYDADGATATAVAVKGLRIFGANVDFLVPNRFEYGYGLTSEIVHLAASQTPDVIITVDNGIASIEGVDAANALGIQVLITDHHLPAELSPNASCIINPNQRGCTFASKSLAGVGVMFYALLALRAEYRTRGRYINSTEPNVAALLDLVALGTVADLVKLDSNNRILVEQGLRRIRAGACAKGITALLQVSQVNAQSAIAQDLAFYVGPRLNAAGRLDDMTLGIQCLLTESAEEAMHIAVALQDLNDQRRHIESEMQASANITIEDITVAHQFSLSLFNPDWHQGVIGILASRIKERHHRPVIAFANANDGILKGSGRSIANLHLRDALDAVTKIHPDLIIKFGGHAMAAGLSIREVDFEKFKTCFEAVVKSLITEADLASTLIVDGALDEHEMQLTTVNLLNEQVWGQGFAPPLFFDTFTVVSQKILKEKHLKLQVKKNASVFDAIYFGYTEAVPDHVTMAYQLNINRYNGQEKVQLMVRYVSDHALT